MGITVENSTAPSLKTQLGLQFKHLEKDFNEIMLRKHAHDLVNMMASNRFRYTCAHSSWYRCIDQQKTILHFEMHAASTCMDICATLGIPINGEFAKTLLGLCLEYKNLFFVKTKREKICINKRINDLCCKIRSAQIYIEGWNANSFIRTFKRDALDLLTEAILVSLK